jgi:hypothetical protein
VAGAEADDRYLPLPIHTTPILRQRLGGGVAKPTPTPRESEESPGEESLWAGERARKAVAVDIDAVISGLKKAAIRGNAQAARELRAWLAERPTSTGSEEEDRKLVVLQPEDMTPEHRERARAWLLRDIARKERRYGELRKLRDEWRQRQAGVQVEDGLSPK